MVEIRAKIEETVAKFFKKVPMEESQKKSGDEEAEEGKERKMKRGE